MDLKDAVLSTLAELEDLEEELNSIKENKPEPIIISKEKPQPTIEQVQEIVLEAFNPPKQNDVNMQKFLASLRERILVLFEGLQTINNSKNSETLNLEKKLDLTINFLEFLLASIEDKLEVAPESN